MTASDFCNSHFSLPFIHNILENISSACRHIHAKGIMHGDIYAHNILTNSEGSAYLGDFGAASFYDPLDNRRERLDIRAFGLLIDDLLRCNKENGVDRSRFLSIQQACTNPVVSERPLFREICNQF